MPQLDRVAIFHGGKSEVRWPISLYRLALPAKPSTRSVAPTQAGERLLQNIGPRFEEIDAELAAVRDLREKPAGTIRITAMEYAADAILLPKLAKLMREPPDIKVEIIID